MSLLGKILLKKYLKPGLIMLIPVFLSCDTTEDLGIDYDLGSGANVKFVEFTLPASNIFIDSTRTDSEGNILAGKFNDNITGSAYAEGYFHFYYQNGPLPRDRATSTNPDPQDTLQIDSIILTFEKKKINPLKGVARQDLNVYELKENLQKVVHEKNLKQETIQLIGNFSSELTNNDKDSIFRFKLSATYSTELFQTLGDISENSLSAATQQFKPLGLIPGANSEAMYSLSLGSDTSKLIVYSSSIKIPGKVYTTVFNFLGTHYSHIDNSNKVGTIFDGILENQDVNHPEGKTFLDPLMGMSTAFIIDELETFFSTTDQIIINNAKLQFDFEKDNNRDTLISYYVFFRNEDKTINLSALENDPFGSMILSDNSYLRGEATYSTVKLNSDKVLYYSNPTLFFQNIYRSFKESNKLEFLNISTGLSRPLSEFVLISADDTSLDRTIIKKGGIKLQLYYTEIE